MPADTAPAWPDPARLGVPMNPERDGTHWLWVSQATGALMAFQWHAPPSPDRVGAWVNIAREITTSHPLDAVRMGLTYCAPCLTPSEVTAREAAAWAAGAAAMRAECERVVQNVVDTYEQERILLEGFRALPLPPMPTQGGAGDE